MADIAVLGVKWVLFVFLGGQVVIFAGLMLWTMWTDAIKPRLIPMQEIDRTADEIISNFADPEEEAFSRHAHAWYRSDGAEQTYWRRVRKAVSRRLENR